MNKNASFRPNLVVFGQQILIFTRESKSFGTHVMEKPPRQLVRIVFGLNMGSNRPKRPIFGQKCQFWAKFGRFGAQNPFFGAWGKTFGTLTPGNRRGTFFVLKTLTSEAQIGRY